MDKLRKQQEREREHLSELREAAEEIQTKICAATTAIEERDRELEAAETELKDLVLRAVGEEATGTQQPAVDPTTGWNSVVETVGRLAQQPGVPEQFTAQLDGLFTQLQQMVNVLSNHALARGENPLQPSAPTCTSAAAGANKAKPSSAQMDDEMVPQLQPERADELRQQQRLARQQRKQTSVIHRIIESHRAAHQHPLQQQPQQHDLQQQQQQEHVRAQQQAAAAASTAAASAAAAAAAMATDGTTDTSGGGCSATPTPPTPQATPVGDSSLSGNVGDGVGELVQVASNGGSPPAAAEAQQGTINAAPSQPVDSPSIALQSAQAEPPSEYGDAESDITGIASDTDREGMDIEAALAGLPPSQKAAVRSLLEAKRAKLARKLQRHKKPADQGAVSTRQSKKK